MLKRISPIICHSDFGSVCGERDGCVTAAVYSSVEQEYQCLRSRVALVDLSHYAKIKVSGDGAQALIDHVILTDLARLPINQLQSTFILGEDGQPLADAFVANAGEYFLVLSEGMEPATVVEQLKALAESKFSDVVVSDQTAELGLVGVEGPYSWELLKSVVGTGIIGTRYLDLVSDQSLDGIAFSLCRAGKSGEYGYMLLTTGDRVAALWDGLRSRGERFNMLPAGYRALDLCKLENRFPSQHNEGSKVGNVLELNTRVLVSAEKGDYLGRDAIEGVIKSGISQRIIGLQFPESLSAADDVLGVGAAVSCAGLPIGQLVNVGYSYSLKRWLGLALVRDAYACVGLDYSVAATNGEESGRTVSAPFLFNLSLKIRPQEDSYFN